MIAESLDEALERADSEAGSAFTEVLARDAVNLILADRRAGLVARVRPQAECPPAAIGRNLEQVAAAAAAGAPILPPDRTQPLLFKAGKAAYAATLWPLADNRLVSPEEMAAVLRGMHDTPPPAGLPGYLELRHASTRRKLARLKRMSGISPAVVRECSRLAEAAMEDSEAAAARAPRVLLHGDGHPGNIVVLDGRPTAIDMDLICAGPLEADFVLAFLHAARYPGADEAAGSKLTAAYGRPYDERLLESLVRSRSVCRILSLVDHWEKPEARAGLLQRLDAVKRGGRFAELYKPETPAPFAR